MMLMVAEGLGHHAMHIEALLGNSLSGTELQCMRCNCNWIFFTYYYIISSM